MTLRGALARAALLVYPRDFRAQFGAEILADIDADANGTPVQLFDLVKGAVLMHLDTLSRDVAYALRRLRAAPLFVTIVVLTFALGIGANVAVFSALNAVVLRALPFAGPSSLVVLSSKDPHGESFPSLSPLDAQDISSRARQLSQVAAEVDEQPTLLVGGKPYALSGLQVSSNYLETLGVRPNLGRDFTAADGNPGVHSAIISDHVWRERFGADPSIVGRPVTLDGTAHRVVGVLAPGQLLVDGQEVDAEDILTVLPSHPPAVDRGQRSAGAIARLASGSTVERANADLGVVSAALTRQYPETDKNWSFSARSLRSAALGGAASSLWILFAGVIGILLIACANVGNMLAARWSSRDRELAVRRALGASSRRIAGQLLIETGVLAILGASIGVGLAYGTLHVLNDLITKALPRGGSIEIDGTSLLYALGIVVVSTLLAGISPVLALRSADLQTVLKSAGRGGDGSRHHRLRAAFVVAEVALAIALVTISGLMLRSFLNTIDAPLGIDTTGVVGTDPVAMRPLTAQPMNGDASMENEVLRRLQALPGVQAAALALFYPSSNMAMGSSAAVFGRTYTHGQPPLALSNAVSPEYFTVFGIKSTLGRTFTESDTAHAAPVAIVSERFVRMYMKGLDPLKARIHVQTGPTQAHWAQVVGVVPDERVGVGPDAEALGLLPEYYVPFGELPQGYFEAVVRAQGVDPAVIGREVDAAFASAMPLQPAPNTFTIAQRVANVTKRERLTTMLLGALGVVALVLALSGIFGVVSFSVTQRWREFGVRIALGASAASIVGDVLRRALGTTAVGVAFGLVVTAVAARAIAPQLETVSPFDPATFTTVVVLVFLAAALASLQPALRATRVEPAESLRYE